MNFREKITLSSRYLLFFSNSSTPFLFFYSHILIRSTRTQGQRSSIMSGDSDQGMSDLTARNSPAGNVNVIPPLGELREPRVSFSTTSNVSDRTSSTVVTQTDLEACMRRMEEHFDTSLERLTRNLVAPSQIDEITNRLDQLSVVSPTQPLHGPYRAQMGPSMYTRPPTHLGFPMPAGFRQRFVEPFSNMSYPVTGQSAYQSRSPHVTPTAPVTQTVHTSPAPRFQPDVAPRFQPSPPPPPIACKQHHLNLCMSIIPRIRPRDLPRRAKRPLQCRLINNNLNNLSYTSNLQLLETSFSPDDLRIYAIFCKTSVMPYEHSMIDFPMTLNVSIGFHVIFVHEITEVLRSIRQRTVGSMDYWLRMLTRWEHGVNMQI